MAASDMSKRKARPGNSSAVDAGVKIRLFEDGEGQSEANSLRLRSQLS
ncbi:MAG: hypothetical protein CM15mP84_07710 [Cellvibrionales bacterium]|nr:MAG: hypothetical protein CM15mP84_07710 [Cellvibrionales bacterium]